MVSLGSGRMISRHLKIGGDDKKRWHLSERHCLLNVHGIHEWVQDRMDAA